MFCTADCDASRLLSMKQDLHVQYYLGGELLCLLCKWQICMGRQAPELSVTATECAHNGKESCCSRFALLYSESKRARVANVCCDPAKHLHISLTAVARGRVMRHM